MNLPAEFVGRVVKTKLSGLTQSMKQQNQITESWPGSYIDVVYESATKMTVVIVFETTEDALAYKLKYGDNYV